MRPALACFILLAPLAANSQKLATGRVIDSDTKKFIKEASVRIAETDTETKSNSYGYFQLILDSTNNLIINAEGYEQTNLHAPTTNTFIVPLFKQSMPGYQGGLQEFYKFLGQTIRYPAAARREGVEGRVYVIFEIDSTFGLQNIRTLRDPGKDCGKEVTEAIKLAPKLWIPKTKLVTIIMPVTFRLGDPYGASKKEFSPLGRDVALPKGKLLNEVFITATGLNTR